MEVVAIELGVIVVAITDGRQGVLASDEDWGRFPGAAGAIQAPCPEYAT